MGNNYMSENIKEISKTLIGIVIILLIAIHPNHEYSQYLYPFLGAIVGYYFGTSTLRREIITSAKRKFGKEKSI